MLCVLLDRLVAGCTAAHNLPILLHLALFREAAQSLTLAWAGFLSQRPPTFLPFSHCHATIRHASFAKVMPSSPKKVILRRFSGELLRGYLPPSHFVQADGIDLLGVDGRRLHSPLEGLRMISFVRDFNLGDTAVPDQLPRKLFSGRPRGEGLWVRLTFRQDNDCVEGLASPDLALFDDLERDRGLYLVPPDTRANTQRLYIPRLAMADLRVLGLIQTTVKRKQRDGRLSVPLPSRAQDTLFGADGRVLAPPQDQERTDGNR